MSAAMSAMDKLEAMWAQGKFLCAGLDLRPEEVPGCLSGHKPEVALEMFSQAIVTATAPIVAAYKPNLQFYLSLDHKLGLSPGSGIALLHRLMLFIRSTAPNALRVLDAKFGDIDRSNEESAIFSYDGMQADAVTVSPYVGGKALTPFMRLGKLVFVLDRTSNEGADELQGLRYFSGRTLYETVAVNAQDDWSMNGDVGLVAGATAPTEIRKIRALAPTLPILIPGIGKQGGDLEAAVQAGRFTDGASRPLGGGFIINTSSSLTGASKDPDFAEAAQAYAADINSQIRQALGRST